MTYISKNGYRVIYAPHHQKNNRKKKGDEYQHRAVWEVYNNCCLTKWAEVHHKNGDKLDNSIENLEAIVKHKHKRLHWLGNQLQKKDMTGRFCKLCRSTTTYVKPDGWPQWFDYEGGHICRKCRDSKKYQMMKSKKNKG